MIFQVRTILTVMLFIIYSSTFAQYKHDSIKIYNGYLHYYTKGKGEAIVLLQGGPGYSSFCMRSIADSLNNNLCVLIDYEGTGRSINRKPDSSWVSPEKIVSDIELVRQKLGIKKWIVLGHSYGTHFGLLYATKYPSRLIELILVGFIGTNNAFQRYSEDNITVRLSETDIEELKQTYKDTLLNSADFEFKTQSILLKGYFYDKSKVVPFLKSVPTNENPFYFNDNFNFAYWKNPNYWTWDITKKALEIEKPIFILQGRQDFVNDGSQTLFSYRAKNCKLHYIEKCGHFAWIEKPVEFFKLINKTIAEK